MVPPNRPISKGRDRRPASFLAVPSWISPRGKGELRPDLRQGEEQRLDLPVLGPGANGRKLFERSAEPYIEAGKPTQLTKEPGAVLEDGYFHGLGHGVGLEIHEAPHLDQNDDVLVEGDVIAVEPGCYRQGFGGVRLEDLVLVTADGGKLLTDYPYELTPAVVARGVAA